MHAFFGPSRGTSAKLSRPLWTTSDTVVCELRHDGCRKMGLWRTANFRIFAPEPTWSEPSQYFRGRSYYFAADSHGLKRILRLAVASIQMEKVCMAGKYVDYL